MVLRNRDFVSYLCILWFDALCDVRYNKEKRRDDIRTEG